MDSTAVKSQIERLLHSHELAGKDQLRKLLEFLFEKNGLASEFDKGFNLLSVKASDAFVSAHAEFYSKAKVEHTFTKMEEDEFRRVNCLAGCGSVAASNRR